MSFHSKMLFLRHFRGRIAQATSGSLVLQVAEAFLGFATSILIARLLGVSEFGAYAFGITLAGFLVIPAALGYRTLAVRQVSALSALGEWGRLKAFTSGALRRVVFSAMVVTLAAYALMSIFGDVLADNMREAALTAILIVPIIALLQLHEGFVRGIDRVVVAQTPNRVFRPSVFFFLAGLASLTILPIDNGADAVVLNLSATVAALLLVVAVWWYFQPKQHPDGPPTIEGCDASFRHAFPFALIASLQVINSQTDVLMLGFLTGADDTGIYRVASRVASLVAFVLTAVSAALAPRISSLYVKSEDAEIQALCSKAAMVSTVASLFIVVTLLFGNQWVLLLFGSDFQAGGSVLIVLSLGQMANALTGVVAPLMSMTGNQKTLARTLTLTAILNVALNAVLIPHYGAEGAAIATMLTFVLWNAALAVLAKRKLGIDVTAVGYIRKRFR